MLTMELNGLVFHITGKGLDNTQIEGEVFIQSFGMNVKNKDDDIASLFGFFFAFVIIGYLANYYQLQQKTSSSMFISRKERT